MIRTYTSDRPTWWRQCLADRLRGWTRRVPWFKADGTIGFGDNTVLVGPWKPWRVPHRFVRSVGRS